MLYMHDVWVNWFEGEENGYGVSYFHEWRKTDQIELLDQVPVLYINEALYSYIENDMRELPKDMLEKIYRRGYLRNGQKRTALEYVCIITDGKDILVFDTIGYHIPIRKSRLIPRQEQIVYEMIQKSKQHTFSIPTKNYQKEYNLLSLEPELMVGLTRKERQLKHILMMALDQLLTTNHLGELRYWLTEWDPKQYPFIHYMNEQQVWQILYDGIKIGWSPLHVEIGQKLIKGQPFLEKMWEIEQNQTQNTSQLK